MTLNVNRIAAVQFKAVQNTMANVNDIMALIGQFTMSQKWIVNPLPINWNGEIGYRLQVRSNPVNKVTDMLAFPSYVIVYSEDLDTVCVLDPNQAVDTYRVQDPEDADMVWSGDAPTVTPIADSELVWVTFRRPNSLLGPYSFALSRNGQPINTGEPTTAAAKTQSGDYIGVVLGLDVTYTVPAVDGDTFTVTVSDDYGHEQTSAPSAAVEFPAPPEPEIPAE